MEEFTALVNKITTLVMEELEQLEAHPFQVPVGISARHIHLERKHVEWLFGTGYRLTPIKAVSQPGQYACKETVEVIGPKGQPVRLRILGPERTNTQIEVSLSDSRILGMIPPVRSSGDVLGTPGIRIRGPKREIEVERGVIIADRHIHMTPEDARWFGVKDGQRVRVSIKGQRGGIMDNVMIRASSACSLDFHIDTDDANAFQLRQGQMVGILK